MRRLRTFASLKGGLLLCHMGKAFDVELQKAGKTCRVKWSQEA
jgi:hypothetical protein